MKQNEVFDLIISLLKPMQSQQEIQSEYKNYKHCIKSKDNYLLGQVLRRYCLSKDKIFVSERAHELWNKICPDEDIKDYSYNKKVTCHNKVVIPKYKGHNQKPEKYEEKKEGDKFSFNDVFHEEHTITIDIIINDKLLKINN